MTRTDACLKACEGIPTEDLEGCFARLRTDIADLIRDLERFDGRTLTRQRIVERLKAMGMNTGAEIVSGEWVAIEPPEGKGCFAVHYGAKQ